MLEVKPFLVGHFASASPKKQKEARFAWGFFLTVQLDNFLITLSECVLHFGFDICFRTTGHDPWFDEVLSSWLWFFIVVLNTFS